MIYIGFDRNGYGRDGYHKNGHHKDRDKCKQNLTNNDKNK